MLDNAAIAAHPRMVALAADDAAVTVAHNDWMRARRAALAASLREEDHFTQTGHHPTGGDNGTCGVCGELVHPVGG